MPVENCFVGSPETMTDKGSLYNSLKVLCYNHALVGCKIDYELLLTDQTEKDKMYSRAKSKGLLPHHMYSILDVRSVMISDHSGKQTEVNLVRLQNVWSDGQEWNGRCSDLNEDFWTE